MQKAVIFDMDGLMIDSERVTFEGYVLECTKLGLVMTEEFYKTVLGLPMKGITEHFKKEFGDDFPMEEVVASVHKMMAERFEKDGVPLKPGLEELLVYLKANEYKTMIATSSRRNRLDVILEQSGLKKYYDDTICGDEIEKGKPHPDVFLKACEKLGVKPEEALVLEDSEAGIQAAFAAGIKVICVPDMKFPGPKYAQKTYRIVESLNEVLDLLKRKEIN